MGPCGLVCFLYNKNISVSEKKLGYPPQLEPGILVDTVGIEAWELVLR
jgi:hypothetical protein